MQEKKKKYDWEDAYRIEIKVADIIARQEQNGWQFNKKQAEKYVFWLETYRKGIYQRIRRHFRLIVKSPYNTPVNTPFLKNGNYSSPVKKWYDDPSVVQGPFTRICWEEPNLDSNDQLKTLLFDLGWKPTQWNYKKDKAGRIIYNEDRTPIKTSPKLTEDSYKSLNVGIGPDVARYIQCGHRASQIRGWLSNLDNNNFIHAGANSLGTPTSRMRHRVVNITASH